MGNNSKVFFTHLHAFRGFAILNIVAAHCWVLLIMIGTQGQVPSLLKPLMAVSETLFHNSTIYFAIISGLLFSLILKEYPWKKFYIGKVKHVFVPYVVFSIILAFLSGMVLIPPDVEPMPVKAVLSAIPMHIITGSSFSHMWYIPILLVLFALTPVFNFILSNKKLLPVLILIILIPIVISRSWPDFTWKNFVFFFAPYIFGMLIGNNYQKTLQLVDRFRYVLWLILLLTTTILAYLYLNEFEPVYGIKLQESFGYINKVSICLIVLTFMHSIENKLPKLLNTLGDYSFSIYFVHMIFVIILGVIMVSTGIVIMTPLSIVLMGILLFISTLMASIGFAWLVKKGTGKYSRLFIGS